MNFAYTNNQLYINVTAEEMQEIQKKIKKKPRIVESTAVKGWSVAVLEWKISEKTTITFQT